MWPLQILVNPFHLQSGSRETDGEILIINYVHLINRHIDAYLKGYGDIEKLAESIGTAAGVINVPAIPGRKEGLFRTLPLI